MKKTLIFLIVLIISIALYRQYYKTQSTNVVFIMGGPGSGKGVQSGLLSKQFGFVHLSIGDVLRKRAEEGGEVGELITGFMKKGELVSNDIVARSLELEFEQKGKHLTYLLDGFPRSVDNFLAYQQHTNKTMNILSLLFIECSDQTMQKRIVERSKSVDRPDNDIQIIRNRIRFFNDQTRKMIQKFKQHTTVLTVSGQGTIEQTFDGLNSKLKQQGFKPIQSEPTL